jgi:CheY-like chemotaxis protein
MAARPRPSLLARADLEDDRESIHAGDRVLLIIDDDATYARILMDAAHERGLKVVISSRGDMGIAMARKFRPAAILLDIGLPDTTGWTVLDQIQHDPDLRHVPIHMLSIFDERRRGLDLGATAYFRKAEGPEVMDAVFHRIQQSIESRTREVLVVNATPEAKKEVEDVLDLDGVHAVYPESSVGAIDAFKEGRFDCVIVCADPEISTADLLVELQKAGDDHLCIMAFTPEGIPSQDVSLTPVREGTVIRRVDSAARLLSEVTRILHVPENTLPEYKRLCLEKLRQVDQELAGCRVLIVDDDVRNIFALTSILERHQIEVLHAENGRSGIDMLLQDPGIDIALMDIMMPGIDGYETIRAIRELETLRNLPIIAVTAKAMKGDREKCIESGASDYIAKPVDLDQLFSLMRVWVKERRENAVRARSAV